MIEPSRNLLQRLEYWDGNNFYGIGNILKKYAGLPWFIPLNFRIQHGVILFSIFKSLEDCAVNVDFYVPNEKSTVLLIFSEHYIGYFHKQNMMNVRAIGAPIIYMDKFINRMKRIERKGTIVFPNHSTHYTDCIADYDLYAEQLTELPSKFQPITVCMYYLDIEKRYDKPFRKRGFDIVSNGSLWCQEFLYNFISNVSGFEYATSNHNASSAAFYSIYLGLKYFRYGPAIEYKLKDYYAEKYQKDYSIMQNTHAYQFPIEQCENYQYQKEIADKELGVASKLSKAEMRSMILGAINAQFMKTYCKTVLPRIRGGRLLLRILASSYSGCKTIKNLKLLPTRQS
jgi:hypothetical protein